MTCGTLAYSQYVVWPSLEIVIGRLRSLDFMGSAAMFGSLNWPPRLPEARLSEPLCVMTWSLGPYAGCSVSWILCDP